MEQPTATFPFTGGLNRSIVTERADRGTFYDLKNYRHKFGEFGLLEETPRFYLYQQYDRFSYWYGGATIQEPVGAAIVGQMQNEVTLEKYIVTDYTLRSAANLQLQVFYQVTVPAAETINTHCLIVINNVSALAITLGSTFDVEIDAATTFRWRKNGGAWTAGVACSTTGTAVDGGNVTVYFLASSGFTIGDLWQWRRTDSTADLPGANMVASVRTTEYTQYGNDVLFLGSNLRIMRLTSTYAISIGYRPIFAAHFAIFEDHLFAIGASTTLYTTATSATASQHRIVKNSDLNDIDNFWSTSVNEADTYTLPLGGMSTGVFVKDERLYVCTMDRIFYTDYLGLPIVFSWREFGRLTFYVQSDYSSNVFLYNNCAVNTDRGVFLMTNEGLYLFNGANLAYIGAPIINITYNAGERFLLAGCRKFYDSFQQELYLITSSVGSIVYQTSTQTFYQRFLAFSTGTWSLFSRNGIIYVGGIDRKLLSEDVGRSHDVVVDASTALGVPTIGFHAIVGTPGFAAVKENQTVFIFAKLIANGTAPYYNVTTAALFQLYWYIDEGSAATDSGATWNSGNTDGRITFPRISGRIIRYELRSVTSNSKPNPGFYLYGFEPQTTTQNITPR